MPWAWEDEEHTADAVRELVDDYRRRGIPIGVVIVDSPWQTGYNTFEFGPNYPDPAGLIGELHDKGVRVLLWATNYVNVSSIDGPNLGRSSTYDEALEAGYFVDGGKTYKWDKGEGSAIDFFNPAAVAWWYARMDRAFGLGADGWKVDSMESHLPNEIDTAAGRRTRKEYSEAYYRAFYRYVVERSPDAIVTVRPYDGGDVYAPVDANPAGWVGDQNPEWGPRGIGGALDNILASAELGYAVLGSDIGGYRPGERFDKLFIRWTQLGALSPLMENGGRGEHRPWRLGRDVERWYRYYAKLHRQLVPYLYSAGVAAHQTGLPIIREPDRERRQYLLGEDLFVAPVVTREDEREVILPSGGRWHDFWDDDRVVAGATVERLDVPLGRIPLYVRAGGIVPMEVADEETGHGDVGSAGHLTLLVYPDGESARTYHPDADRSVELRSRQEVGRVTVEVGPGVEKYTLRVKESAAVSAVALDRGGTVDLPGFDSRKAFDRGDQGWHYDASRRYLWVRFAAPGGARIEYQTR